MTKEEKIQYIQTLINISGNTTKVVRYLLLQALPSVDEEKLDILITILEAE